MRAGAVRAGALRVIERPTVEEVLRRARAAAFGPRQFVGQESFVRASEVLSLGLAAGIVPGVTVLDLCCGTAGPGLFLTRHLDCEYVGVDERASSITSARRRAVAAGLRSRFEVGRIPPLPQGRFDVVLLLETLLAFPDKGSLLRAVAARLSPGGRFALTLEAGHPLAPEERAAMPGSDSVWPTPLDELVDELTRVGLRVRWHQEWSASHQATADALAGAYENAATDVHQVEEREAVDRLVAAHRLWSQWLQDGRIRKHALVAERPGLP